MVTSHNLPTSSVGSTRKSLATSLIERPCRIASRATVAAFSYPIVGARAVTTERLDSAYARKCKAQMRSIASIQDAHSIKDIMKAQGIPDSQAQAPPPIPQYIDTVEAIDALPFYDSFEPSLDDF